MSAHSYEGGEWPAEQYFAAEFQASDDTEWHNEESPVLNLGIGEHRLKLTRDNCRVYVNSRSEDLHHIYHMREGQKPIYVYRGNLPEGKFDEVIEAMARADYTFVDSHEPTEQDANIFVDHQMNGFDETWAKIWQAWTDEVNGGQE